MSSAGGSMGGHDPRAHGKIASIVRTFGSWAHGKQSIAAKKLLAKGIAKSPEHANALCFMPGTLIQTEAGLVEIENLVPGDMVRTHLGRYRPVDAVVCSHMHYEGDMIELRTRLSHVPLVVTPAHMVWAARGAEFWEGTRTRKRSRKARAAAGQESPVRTTVETPYANQSFGAPRLIAAEDIRDSDYLLFPVQREVEDRPDVSDDDLFFIGLYAGDGHIARGTSPSIAFGRKDAEVMDRYIAYVERRTGHTPRVSDHGKYGSQCWNVAVRSKQGGRDLAEMFHEACPGNAYTKRFAPWVMALPAERLRRVLDGFWSADGHIRPNRAERVMSLANLDLVLQVRDMLLALGERPRVRKSRSAKASVIKGREVQNRDAWSVSYSPGAKKSSGLMNDEWIALPVSSVKRIPYSGPVYDAEVREDHTLCGVYVSMSNSAWLKDQWAGTTKWRGDGSNPKQKAEDAAISAKARATAEVRFPRRRKIREDDMLVPVGTIDALTEAFPLVSSPRVLAAVLREALKDPDIPLPKEGVIDWSDADALHEHLARIAAGAPTLVESDLIEWDPSQPRAPKGTSVGGQFIGALLDTVNPSGTVHTDYDPSWRASAKLAPNITTLATTRGIDPDTKIAVYRGVPKGAQTALNPGDFVTTDRRLAKDYAGTGDVISQEVSAGDLLDEIDEPDGGEHIFRPRSLLEGWNADLHPRLPKGEGGGRFTRTTSLFTKPDAEELHANLISPQVMSTSRARLLRNSAQARAEERDVIRRARERWRGTDIDLTSSRGHIKARDARIQRGVDRMNDAGLERMGRWTTAGGVSPSVLRILKRAGRLETRTREIDGTRVTFHRAKRANRPWHEGDLVEGWETHFDPVSRKRKRLLRGADGKFGRGSRAKKPNFDRDATRALKSKFDREAIGPKKRPKFGRADGPMSPKPRRDDIAADLARQSEFYTRAEREGRNDRHLVTTPPEVFAKPDTQRTSSLTPEQRKRIDAQLDDIFPGRVKRGGMVPREPKGGTLASASLSATKKKAYMVFDNKGAHIADFTDARKALAKREKLRKQGIRARVVTPKMQEAMLREGSLLVEGWEFYLNPKTNKRKRLLRGADGKFGRGQRKALSRKDFEKGDARDAPSAPTPEPRFRRAKSIVRSFRHADGTQTKKPGITYHPVTNRTPRRGFAVAIPDNEAMIIPLKDFNDAHVQKFLDDHRDVFEKNTNVFLGGWVEDDQVFLELSQVYSSRTEARKVARARGEIAIWDLAKNDEDRLMTPEEAKKVIANDANPGGKSLRLALDGQDTQTRYTLSDGVGGRVYTDERTRVQDAIIEKLFEGAVPAEGTPTAIFLAGGSASGKSTIEKGLDTQGMVTIDSDAIKKMLPEYIDLMKIGGDARAPAAMNVHEESSDIAARAYEMAKERGFSVVIDGTGNSGPGKFLSKLDDARDSGYDVDVVYVSAPTAVAQARAKKRAERDGRLVPPEVIASIHKGVSRAFEGDILTSDYPVQVWDTGAEGQPPALIYERARGAEGRVKDQTLFSAFLAKAKE